MADPESERLTVSMPMMMQSNMSSFSGGAPPFAPQPHYAMCDQDNSNFCRTSSSTGRSGTVITTTGSQGCGGPPGGGPHTPKQSKCGFHQVCHHVQQVVFVSAILTGIALVIAGAVLTNGDLVVFVYIGVLLIGVNSALLAIQCYVHYKQKQRTSYNATASNRQSATCPSNCGSSAQQYAPVNTKPPNLQLMSHNTIPVGSTIVGTDFASPQSSHAGPRSPSDSHIKYFSSVHSMVSYRQGGGSAATMTSSPGHHCTTHHYNRNKYKQSPPMGQQRRVIHVNQMGDNYPSLPPPTYNELIARRDGSTTVHLI